MQPRINTDQLHIIRYLEIFGQPSENSGVIHMVDVKQISEKVKIGKKETKELCNDLVKKNILRRGKGQKENFRYFGLSKHYWDLAKKKKVRTYDPAKTLWND